jgi:ribosomal protein L9
MPAKSKQRRFTAAQINEHLRTIQKAIKKHKRENKGEHFTAVTREEIERKLKRANSPMIISQGWSGTAPGGTVNYNGRLQP